MKNPPIIYFAKHRFTGSIIPYDVVASELADFPEHEYEILVVEFPRQYAADIISHGTVKKTCSNIKEAADFIHREYPRTGYYPSKGEFESKAKYGLPKVGPYMPTTPEDDDGK
jgi:hypothetical protein